MNNKEFQEFLCEKIPILKAIQFDVLEINSCKVKLRAKLEPNKNHMGIAFAGSINTLMTLCGWSSVYANISEIDSDAKIVLQKSSVRYIAPIKNDFTAECILQNEDEKNDFFKMYNKRGKSKLEVKVRCYDKETLCAEFQGKYVAIK